MLGRRHSLNPGVKECGAVSLYRRGCGGNVERQEKMFGRLSEAKRAKAVDLMDEMVNFIARMFITWSTDKEFFLTPTKPYVDEVFILSSVAIYLPYVSWRKKRPDAWEDVLLSSSNIYSDVFEKYGSEWPFRTKANNPGELMVGVGDIVDERFKEYEIAWHDELVNKEAELKKHRHKHGGGGDWIDDAIGTMGAELPFADLVIRRLFDVDPNNKDESDDYRGFAYQVVPLMSKRGDVFMQYLKRL